MGTDKFSSVVYRYMYKLHASSGIYFSFLEKVRNTLNDLGFSGFWFEQWTNLPPLSSFKKKIKERMMDQFVQTWTGELQNNELFYNYRIFKKQFQLEPYLLVLPQRLIPPLVRFRTLNHRFPIQTGRAQGIDRQYRICRKCNKGLGDEFHYLLECEHFSENRRQFIKPYFFRYPNTFKMDILLNSNSKTKLLKLCRFLKFVLQRFWFNVYIIFFF